MHAKSCRKWFGCFCVIIEKKSANCYEFILNHRNPGTQTLGVELATNHSSHSSHSFCLPFLIICWLCRRTWRNSEILQLQLKYDRDWWLSCVMMIACLCVVISSQLILCIFTASIETTSNHRIGSSWIQFHPFKLKHPHPSLPKANLESSIVCKLI